MARPKKAEHERREDRVEIGLTTAERVHIEQLAGATGVSLSEFVRRRALGYRLPAMQDSPAKAALATALIRLGVNLNQIARALHGTGQLSPDLPPLIARINGELDRLYGSEAD